MKNQKGFGAIEALLIVVIVGLIGFVGWYVWNSKQETDKNLNSAANTNLTGAATKKRQTTTVNTKPVDPYAGWNTYEYKGVSFRYPSNWKIINGAKNSSYVRLQSATHPAGVSDYFYLSFNYDNYPSKKEPSKVISTELVNGKFKIVDKSEEKDLVWAINTADKSTKAGETSFLPFLDSHIDMYGGYGLQYLAYEAKQAQFDKQPEIITAKKIIRSLNY